MTQVTNRARKKPRQWTAEVQKRFLTALAGRGIVADACRAADVSRQTAYVHRDKDEAFAQVWQDAVDDWADVLEAEADRRALGYDDPIVYQGKIQKDEDGKVATVKRYSDRMLELRLKGLRPERYSDKFRLAGKDGGPVEIKVVV